LPLIPPHRKNKGGGGEVGVDARVGCPQSEGWEERGGNCIQEEKKTAAVSRGGRSIPVLGESIGNPAITKGNNRKTAYSGGGSRRAAATPVGKKKRTLI